MWYFFVAGACGLGSVLLIMALARRKPCSYEEHRRAWKERIHTCEDSIREDALRMSAPEHMALARAAVREMLNMGGAESAWTLESAGPVLRLRGGEREWRLEAEDAQPRQLRHRNRVICAPSGWRLYEMRAGETLSAQNFPHIDMALAGLQAEVFPTAEHFFPARQAEETAGHRANADPRDRPQARL